MRRGKSSFVIAEKAFTLVELLVVIAIISILAGMLMPALENAIDSAHSISCQNNLKQVGSATSLYYDDYSGWIPFSYHTVDGYVSVNSPAWYVLLAPYFAINPNSTLPYSRLETQSNPIIFTCPSDKVTVFPTVYPVSYAPERVTASSSRCVENNNLRRPKISLVKNPSKKLWLIDSTGTFSSRCQYYAGGMDKNFAPWHNGSSNVLFFDNHVEWRPDYEILAYPPDLFRFYY